MTHDEVKHDPGRGTDKQPQMSKQSDEITPTAPGLEVTSPNALSGKPSGYLVGSGAPGHVTAPESKVEGTRSSAQSAIPEYRHPPSRLPEQISAREIANDRSNPDGCQATEVQR
jgi:hypothetical protein